MIIDYTPQGTPEWMALRLGKPSASRASEIYTMTGVVSKSRIPYMEELAWEAITGTNEETYKSKDMQAGNDKEGDSRAEFEWSHDVVLTQVGCVFYDDAKLFLASPDGLILPWEEGFETKNAKRSVQSKVLHDRKPDPDHWCQMQMGMLCTGYKAWWYQRYCFQLPTLTLKIPRDEKYISALHHELDVFCVQLEQTVERFRNL